MITPRMPVVSPLYLLAGLFVCLGVAVVHFDNLWGLILLIFASFSPSSLSLRKLGWLDQAWPIYLGGRR
jgi:hypothetical protein